MAVDRKYGLVILEHGDIGEDEPVVVFRAKDKLLPELLYKYLHLCSESGSPERHLDLIRASYGSIREWQDAHPDNVRTPTSEASKSWMD
jgi:hypothetical protein